MIQINDLVNYNEEQYICWFIEEINGETYIHLKNDNIGICVLLEEINKQNGV